VNILGKNAKRILSATAVGAAVLAGSIALTPGAAWAVNSLKCNDGFTGNGHYTNCTGGHPEDDFRPYVTCYLPNHPNSNRYGTWMHNGYQEVDCLTGWEPIGGGHQLSSP